MKNYLPKILVLLGLGMTVSFWLMGAKNLDPDFGWHVSVGQLIAKSGLPKTDPYSYTMPGWPWVDHGWLTDYLIGRLYPVIGRGGLAVFFAVISGLVFWVAVPRKNWKWIIVPLLLGWCVLLTRSGIRPQVEDWLIVAILLRILDSKEWRKWRWITPALFIVWANFHGGWAIGLVILGAGIAGKWWEEKKPDIKEVIIWILCLGATTVNPYGWRLWHEIWLTASDSSLRWTIAEWQPFYVKAEMGYWLSVVLWGTFLTKYFRIFPKWKLLVAGLLFGAGLSSLRHMPLFLIAAAPMTAELLDRFYEEIKQKKVMVKKSKQFYLILLAVAVVIGGGEVVWQLWQLRNNPAESYYPVYAVEFLKTKNIKERLFTNYSWGGYVIWKLPGEKVFIDGRMPSWRWTPPDNYQSKWAMKDYLEAADEKKFEKIFDKYGVNTVMWFKEEEPKKPWVLAKFDQFLRKFGLTLYKNSGKESFGQKLVRLGWKVIYEDKVAVIYEKN